MKHIKNLLFLLLPLTLQAQISFEKGTLSEAFARASVLRKPVFVMIYADGCPHCEHYQKTFDVNRNVGAFYNRNFVNYRVEVNSEEGRKFRANRKIYVMSTPLMTFWSPDSTLLSITPAGDEQNNEAGILEFAGKALKAETQWETMKRTFSEGYSDPDFLVNVAYLSRYTSDTTINLAAMRKYGAFLRDKDFENDGFLVLQKVIIDDENPLFLYAVNNLPLYYSKYGEGEVNRTLENIVMFSLYSGRASGFSLLKLAFMKEVLKKIKVPEKSIRGRFLIPETSAMFKKGETEKAVKLINDFFRSQGQVSREEAGFIKKYVSNYTSDSKILASIQWITQQAGR